MILTVIESPFAPTAVHTVEDHLRYVRACMADSFKRGEAPFPSHALYTQPGVLDDTIPEERKLGMEAGFAWGKWASRVAVYMDLGMSKGMREGIDRAYARGSEVWIRTLGGIWSSLASSDDLAVRPEGVRREARNLLTCLCGSAATDEFDGRLVCKRYPNCQ
jgi:hypothetical protein